MGNGGLGVSVLLSQGKGVSVGRKSAVLLMWQAKRLPRRALPASDIAKVSLPLPLQLPHHTPF